MFAQLLTVKPLDNYSIFVAYKDGVQGVVDLGHLAKKGVFCQWDKNNLFQKAHISDYGAIAWNDELDICPDSVYLQLCGLTYEESHRKLETTMTTLAQTAFEESLDDVKHDRIFDAKNAHDLIHKCLE